MGVSPRGSQVLSSVAKLVKSFVQLHLRQPKVLTTSATNPGAPGLGTETPPEKLSWPTTQLAADREQTTECLPAPKPEASAYGSRSRRAFSLIELLIVLGILAVIATLTLPALRGPMDKARLRGAARDIETAIAKTRSFAIRTGQPHWFVYEPGGRSWRIETNVEPTADDEATSTPSGLTVEGPQPLDQTNIVRTGEIPDGVTFANEPDVEFQTEPTDVLIEPGPTSSEPIRFTPIGRTANRQLIVNGTRDFEMQITVRGLTGSVAAELKRRIEPTEGDEFLTGDPELLKPGTERVR